MGEDTERVTEGKARKAEGREKQTKSLRYAMGHEAKRDREIKKEGGTTAKKRNANERRRKRQAGRRCGARKQKRRSGAEARSSAAERQREKDRRDGKSKRIGEKHAMTQCINMHKRAKTSINVEVLANDKTYVPHETRTQRNALPCTACGNRGSRKSLGGASNGSSTAKVAADLAEGARTGREKRAEAECRRAAER